MALRVKTQTTSFRDHIEALRSRQKNKVRTTLELIQLEVSSWELYRSCDFVTTANMRYINGIATFALREAKVEPYIPLDYSAKIMLAKGYVLYKLEEELVPGQEAEMDGEPVYRYTSKYLLCDHDIIQSALFRDDETLRRVIEHYCYDQWFNDAHEPIDEYREGATSEKWEYHAQYDDGDSATISWTRYPVGQPEDERAVSATEPLSQFPFTGVQWVDRRSLIEPVKTTIMRYEAAYLNWGGENDRHSRRVKTYPGVTSFAKEHDELVEEGRERVPEGTVPFFADPHAEALIPMQEELKFLDEEIRDAVGAIKVKELHNNSGASRDIEIAPLKSQADNVRERIQLLVQLVDPTARLTLAPLTEMDAQQTAISLKSLRQSLIEGTITDEEYLERARVLQGLPASPIKGSLRPLDMRAVQTAMIPQNDRNVGLA